MRRLGPTALALVLAATLSEVSAQSADAPSDATGPTLSPSLVEALVQELAGREKKLDEAPAKDKPPTASAAPEVLPAETVPAASAASISPPAGASPPSGGGTASTTATMLPSGTNPAPAPGEAASPSEGDAQSVGPVYAFVPKDARKSRPRAASDLANVRASRALAQGRTEDAVQISRRALAQDPRHREIRLRLAEGLVRSGQSAAATETLLPLLGEKVNDWRPWFWAGTAALLSGRYPRAAQYLDAALARDRRHPEIWVQRALVESMSRRPRVAANLLIVARGLAPQHAGVLWNLGLVAEQANDPKLAAEAYRAYLAGAEAPPPEQRAQVLARLQALGTP